MIHSSRRRDGAKARRGAYAVPGLLSWVIAIGCVAGMVLHPAQWRAVATVFVAYLVGRMLLTTCFAFAGEVRCRAWAKRDWTADEATDGPAGFSPAEVRHVVLVPNYKEPLDVLIRTLEGLAIQHEARERIIAVLAMEEREPGSRRKGEELAARFADRFLNVLVTVHPADLPGELACKAANMTWAAAEARAQLDRLGIPVERATITSCDADSVMHPSYYAAVSHLFAHDERRWRRFWQAPMLYYNNIWSVPAPIRYSTWLIQAGHMAELNWPFYASLPISTYTLSMQLAEETGWWDPAVISEDWHVYLRCLFEREWDVHQTAVFLPTRSDATDGPSPARALVNRYHQVLRHAWGAEDVGYMLSEMLERRRPPGVRAVARLAQVTHDHVMRVAGWFFVVSAYALQAAAQHAYAGGSSLRAVRIPPPPTLQYLFAVGGVCIAATIALELFRNPPPRTVAFGRVAAEIAAMWFLAPLMGLLLGVVPALHAQTKLALGLPLAWRVTPKRLASRLGEI